MFVGINKKKYIRHIPFDCLLLTFFEPLLPFIMKTRLTYLKMATLLLALCMTPPLWAQQKKDAAKTKPDSTASKSTKDPFQSGTFNGLSFRSIGPALTSGRVVDFAVNPHNSSVYYVASAAGGVWKTINKGTTYTPIFDGQGSYSIGCVSIDPGNTNVVWVGSGENNNQRAASYGDGVYKSEDAGKSWKRMGLDSTEHIGKIVVDPTNSDVVYVAAYGPLWSAGGQRGIYKTTDGGKNWKCVLYISENTGCNEIHMDPRNSNVLYATAHQRRRQVYTYISGGPESAIYKSTDGGATWNKLTNGLPGADMGRIGMAISPVNPDYLYAVIESTEKNGGVYRSTDRGASWEKMGDYATAGNYYQELFCDPKDLSRIYITDMYFMVSDDGGKSFHRLGETNKHVDNHALWVDPENTAHMLTGCDGGVYETYDTGKSWQYKANLPVTQFYKVTTDNALPFYNVYGGTQDNNSLGGPSRTISGNGIMNSDWFVTSTGDGFETQVDPNDPNIIYSQSQYGGIVRFDRKSGEMLDIRPVEPEGEAYRWNWDTPLLISQHDPKRLYFGANKLFRTNDRGISWEVISPDLTRQLDRNQFPVMGKVWSVDAVAKNQSTDIYGNLVTIAESPLDANLLYTGTDDGLIQVTQDGGKSWTKIDNIPGVPERTYVNQIVASRHDRNTVYAMFNHHRYGNFQPYLYKSTDAGKTWTAIQHNLPQRGSVYCLAEDHVNPDLLFTGTEFGVFFSIDGGEQWIQLKGGLPTVAVRDMEIQRRENDLVIATFGRGFYILDNYTPLRGLKKEDLQKDVLLFPVKDGLMYNEYFPLGVRGKGFQGESFFTTPNPGPGAVFTWYLKEDVKTIKEKRREAEKAKAEKKETVYYPSIDSLRLEDNQPAPYLLFTIRDEDGNEVRRIKAPAKKGLQRIAWDFRYASPGPVNAPAPDPENVFSDVEKGAQVMPGVYSVSLSKFEDGAFTELAGPQAFHAVLLKSYSLPIADRQSLQQFYKKVSALRRAVSGADAVRGEMASKMNYIKTAILEGTGVDVNLQKQAYDIERRLIAVNTLLNGDATRARREFETTPSIQGRIGNIEGGLWSTSSESTQTYQDSYRVASKQFGPVLEELKSIQAAIGQLEKTLDLRGAPYSPGRLPDWKEQ